MSEVVDTTETQMFASVWDALEDSPAEAVAMRLRSELMTAIQDSVVGWKLSRTQAALRLQLTEPRLDELVRGSVGRFSLDDLIALAERAGLTVQVRIERSAA